MCLISFTQVTLRDNENTPKSGQVNYPGSSTVLVCILIKKPKQSYHRRLSSGTWRCTCFRCAGCDLGSWLAEGFPALWSKTLRPGPVRHRGHPLLFLLLSWAKALTVSRWSLRFFVRNLWGLEKGFLAWSASVSCEAFLLEGSLCLSLRNDHSFTACFPKDCLHDAQIENREEIFKYHLIMNLRKINLGNSPHKNSWFHYININW